MASIKKLTLLFLIIATVISASAYLYWQFVCISGGCSYDLSEAFLRPMVWGGLSFALSLATISLFNRRVVKCWLLLIFSWYLPLSLYIISTINIRSSSWFLHVERGHTIWLLGILLYLITAAFTLIAYLWFYKKQQFTKSDLRQLWLLIPTSVVVYFLTQIFF